MVGNGRSRGAVRRAGVADADWLLRDESSALPMTAKLRHGRGGELIC